jgi:alpha-1,2-mannosyltransferase
VDKFIKWLHERLLVYPQVLVITYVIFTIGLIISALASPSGQIDFLDRPLGGDFSYSWLASSLALNGKAVTIFNFREFFAAQEVYFKAPIRLNWFYPPTYLLIIYPLGLLPYLSSLTFWLGVTMSGYLLVVRRIAPHPRTLWLAISFYGTFENFYYGQNGFLIASLLGGGLLLVDNNPVLAGCLLGLVTVKPQLAALLPIALLGGRRWKALLSFFVCAGILAVVSYLAFGQEVWLAFIKNLSLPMELLQTQTLQIIKVITVFPAVLYLGLGIWTAWFIQIVAALGATALVFYVWRREAPFPVRASVLVLCIFLSTPYAMAYDLTILALPLAWLGWEGYTKGWKPREQLVLFIGWCTPLIATVLSFLSLPLTFLIFLALLIMAFRRSGSVKKIV